MSIIQESIVQNPVKSREENAAGRDFRRSMKCLLALFIVSCIAAPIYFLFHSPTYAMGIIGATVVGLSFYHTPFALMFLIFFFPLEGAFAFSQIGMGSRVIGLVVFLSYLVTRFRGKFYISTPYLLILLFNLFAIFSILWAVNQNAGVEGNKSLTLNVILIFILLNSTSDVRQLRLLLWALFIGGIVVSLMVVFGDVSYASGGEKMGRVILAEGTSPNILGNSILMAFFAGFYFFNEKSKINKFIFIVAGPLMLYAILNTQNRTALGNAVVSPIIAFLFSAKGKYLVKNIAGIIGICILGYGLVYIALNTALLSDYAKERLRASDSNLEESGRIGVWKKGLEFLSQRPFNGWGWKNFPEKFPVHQKSLTSAHNNIVAVAGELGLIGLVMLLFIYFVIFKQILKISHPPLRWMAIVFLMFTLIAGTTETTIIQKGFWYSMGFTLLGIKISEDMDVEKKEISENSKN